MNFNDTISAGEGNQTILRKIFTSTDIPDAWDCKVQSQKGNPYPFSLMLDQRSCLLSARKDDHIKVGINYTVIQRTFKQSPDGTFALSVQAVNNKVFETSGITLKEALISSMAEDKFILGTLSWTLVYKSITPTDSTSAHIDLMLNPD
ncbi:hypothetical protein [Pseudomonas fluorescens]|jgi:hypothetical protein|uniref:hypothetical protein n=1 Tax=Pseudomonas fluorescens TaxID=294 RepID=UPI001911FC00|nr:hypothetical protein [Pseudomonas fluorescens]